MISVWWLIPAIAIGAFFGILVVALVSANDNTDRKEKWWNDGNL